MLGDARERLAIAAARYRLGLVTSEHLKELGEWLAGRGLDEAVSLAVVDEMTMAAFGPVFERLCQETWTAIPQEREAIGVVIRQRLTGIIEGALSPADGLETLRGEVFDLARRYDQQSGVGVVGAALEISPLVGLYWEMADAREARVDGKLTAPERDAFDVEILRTARDWLEEHRG